MSCSQTLANGFPCPRKLVGVRYSGDDATLCLFHQKITRRKRANTEFKEHHLNKLWPELAVGDIIVFNGKVRSTNKYKQTVQYRFPWLFGRVTEKNAKHAIAVGITYKSTTVHNDPVTHSSTHGPDDTTGERCQNAIPLLLMPNGSVKPQEEQRFFNVYDSDPCHDRNFEARTPLRYKNLITWETWDGVPLYTSSSCD